jgi:metal-responsive CopG/Arc/MetJ family transcriptional regulator
MTTARPPLSVRLDRELAEALDRHCAQTGATRSQVVQQSVAQYLVVQTGPTLSGLAEAVLPPLTEAAPAHKARTNRQKRYRDYAREKRRR